MADYTVSHPVLFCDADPDWSSICEHGDPFKPAANGPSRTRWRPVRRDSATADFAGLENALQDEIHRDVKIHYGSYWSNTLFAQAPEGPVDLIYLWNEQDIDRLIENLIGHVVACRNNKVPFAAFFATTGESSEHFLSVNNKSGVVQLELPGKGVVREVAENLASFYHSLVPSLDDISQHSY